MIVVKRPAVYYGRRSRKRTGAAKLTSDFWEAYALVFPEETHHSVGKESGQTNHMERWNNTLRQWNARYVRKTLSFSKKDFFHELVTRLFIIRYNLDKLSLTT